MNVAEHRAGPLQGVLLLLPITMAVMGLVVLVPVLPGMIAQFRDVPGVEYLVPLMLTLPALCVAALGPIAGIVVDSFGRRRTCIGALVIYGLVGMLPIILNSLTAIIASRFMLGAMEALIVTSSTTLIGDYFHGREREKWLANQTAVASIASIFLALLGGALGNLSWRGPFAAYGVSILFAIGLMLWTWEPRKSEEPSSEVAGSAARHPWGAVWSARCRLRRDEPCADVGAVHRLFDRQPDRLRNAAPRAGGMGHGTSAVRGARPWNRFVHDRMVAWSAAEHAGGCPPTRSDERKPARVAADSGHPLPRRDDHRAGRQVPRFRAAARPYDMNRK